ncbi:MAG: extracellular solute-binding protein [Anaerolineae bacterium]|nr:extracellular solute-binding protein [Anaerolineae bacterium]
MMLKHIPLILLGLVLVSCSVLASSPPTPAADETNQVIADDLPPVNPDISADPISLEVWVDLDFTRDNTFFEEMAADFEQAYPHVDVEVYSFVREGILQRMEHVSKDEFPPNVVQGHVYTAAALGLAEPMERRWLEWEEADSETTSQFLPSALDEVTWQGIRYGVPIDVYTVVLLYNRNHFDEANLPYPEAGYNLFDLQNAAVVLSRPDEGRYGIGLTTDPWYVYAWVSAAGGDVVELDPEGEYKPALATETNIDVLNFLINLVKDGYAPRPSSRPRDYEEVRQGFLDGKISMFFGEPHDIHLIQSTNPDFPLGVAELPKTPAGESAASVFGSSGFFIPRGSIDQDVAFEFIKWASSDRYSIPMARRVGHYPARVWLQTSPEFTENLSLTPFFKQLDAARPYRLDLFPKAEEAFWDAVKLSFYDRASPRQALEEAQQRSQSTVTEVTP